MLFTAIVRDYFDLFCVNYSSNWELCLKTVYFFAETFSTFIYYILSFGWIRDISYLPATIPTLQANLLSSRFILENSIYFSEPLNILSGETLQKAFLPIFSVGFANSFFCCLPLSTSHFLSVRRLFVQGEAAGVTSTIGSILGQCFFFGCTLLGFRSFVIPWFSLEPFSYILGLILLFRVIYEMANERRIRPINWSEKTLLKNIFLLSFFLSWTEQSSFFQYLKNVTVSSSPTFLDIESAQTGYVLGLLVGHIFFSFIFIFLSLQLKKAFFSFSKLPYSVLLKKLNFVCLSVTLGLSLTSIPFYSFDYLLGAPLGFISQDKALSKSVFAQNELEDPNRLLTSLDGIVPYRIDTDISYFDRANFGDQPGFFQRTFEELNYQGEYAWISRRDKKPNLYTSAQTTKTTILDFFKSGRDEPIKEEESPTVGPVVRTPHSKPSDSLKKSNSKDRPKLKRRFDENYEENRSLGFILGDAFAPPLETEVSPLEKRIKGKFALNPIYTKLLDAEVDAYLNRSPDSILSGKEESELFFKRKLLIDYYDTLRQYTLSPYKEDFQAIFQGSKSFVDRVFHHQFKGTSKNLKSYFPLSFNSSAQFFEKDGVDSPTEREDFILKYDQPLFASQDFPEHEELDSPESIDKPFLEVSDSTPLYLCWDATSNKMSLTNDFSPGMSSVVSPLWKNWPVSKEDSVKYAGFKILLDESTENPDLKSLLIPNGKSSEIHTMPSHFKYLGKMHEQLAPNYGGFVWPGSQTTN
jgi:hypothetical protein